MTANLAALDTGPLLSNVLIAGHAISAAVAFILGAALALRRGARPAQGWAYVAALTLMTLFVTGAVILDWNGLEPAIKGLFAALIALALYTVWRGWQARAKLLPRAPALPGAIEDLGFTLITLFTGFVVILARDLGGPIWLTVVLGVLAVATGRLLVALIKGRRQRAENQLTAESTAWTPAATVGRPRTRPGMRSAADRGRQP